MQLLVWSGWSCVMTDERHWEHTTIVGHGHAQSLVWHIPPCICQSSYSIWFVQRHEIHDLIRRATQATGPCDLRNFGTICRDPRSGSINIHEKREKNPRIFLEFWVNIMWSAERSSAYCHYSSFYGRHHHSIFTPSDDIEYQTNTDKYPSLLLVLWCQKTCNNARY